MDTNQNTNQESSPALSNEEIELLDASRDGDIAAVLALISSKVDVSERP